MKYYNIPIYMYRIGRDEQSMSLEGLKRHYKDAVKYYKEVLMIKVLINHLKIII